MLRAGTRPALCKSLRCAARRVAPGSCEAATDEVSDLAGAGLPVLLGLGEDGFPVYVHLEAAAGAFRERNSVEVIAELADDLVRHTDGVGSVPSFLAVDNLYIHGVCASCWIVRSCHW
jgi:hypothetical protein